MKKYIAVSLSLFILIFTTLCGCSQYKCRDEVKKYGESAVLYAEQYINGLVTADEAYQKIKFVSKKLSEYCQKTHNDTMDSSMKLCESSLDVSVNTLCIRLLTEDMSGGYISEIKESIDDIKQYISY